MSEPSQVLTTESPSIYDTLSLNVLLATLERVYSIVSYHVHVCACNTTHVITKLLYKPHMGIIIVYTTGVTSTVYNIA